MNARTSDVPAGIDGIPARLYRARALKSARLGRPFPQREVAQQVGVTEGQVGHWEKGRFMPDLAQIELLSRALDVEPVWLSYGVGPMDRADSRPTTIEHDGATFPSEAVHRVPDEQLDRDDRVAEGARLVRKAVTGRKAAKRKKGGSR